MTLNPIHASTKPKNKLDMILGSGDIGTNNNNVYKEIAARIRITDLAYSRISPVLLFLVYVKYLFTEVFNEV
ncbi:hypothetical protein GCM10011511_21220 [Puia dinghuensis]|uniref:Uncharacterized protein n=1 Tax=Puia dinghuensis TaxID=1792502 RepID=A0A8J2XTB1_9BACT|nr:hypothetical protein GCM10011511_21220 [Puia dinghuensis]